MLNFLGLNGVEKEEIFLILKQMTHKHHFGYKSS